MSTPNACNILRKTESRRLIVATDFAATGRITATFSELVGMLSTDLNFWEVAPVPYGHETGMTGIEQADRWANDVRKSGFQVHAVIGFCAGSVYAGALAERIAKWQEEPKLILLDPAHAQRIMLIEHVERWLSRLSATFEPDQLQQAKQALQDVDAEYSEPLELAAGLARLYSETITPALVRANHSEAAARELTKLIRGYFFWLAGAVQLAPGVDWSKATALNSDSTGFGLHLIPPEERAGVVAKVTYFDIAHFDMLRTARIACTVDELLG